MMDSFEQFKEELRETLAHLHDPDYQPSELLYAVLGRHPRHGAGAIQSDIIQAIRDLEPPHTVPTTSQVQREFDLLYHRFVLKLTQEETGRRLHMSARSVRRAQRAATHTLARSIWEHSLAYGLLTPEDSESEQETQLAPRTVLNGQMPDWRSQVKRDLASLHMGAPGTVTNVAETIERALELESGLTSKYGIALTVKHLRPDLMAAIHPSALRQILIMAIAKLARRASLGQISIETRLEGGDAKIILTASVSAATGRPDIDLIHEILTSQGGSSGLDESPGSVSLWMKVPCAGQVTVLVVDDNPDMVHLYRRYTSGTKYYIIHAAQGQRTFAAIRAVAPDIVVLDIILPDADGWDLLTQLHADPATRSIPVIICSIVKEEDLASVLGAVLYLPKPVHHQQFIQALDQALDQAPT
jgi:CheY-like chemotaxis protein